MINLQNVKAKVGQDFESVCPFPIGAIYTSMTDTSPAESFGGTWTVIDGGKYLRAANDSQAGGSDTISVKQMPSHTHGTTRSISETLSTNSEGTANFALTGKVVDREYTWDVFTTSAGGATVLPDVSKRVRMVQGRLTKRAVMSSGIH